MAVPVGVVMASLTPPCGSANATASIDSLMPRSGIADPRAMSSVVLTSRPAFFAAAAKSFAPFSSVAIDAARCFAISAALSCFTSSATLVFTSSSFGM